MAIEGILSYAIIAGVILGGIGYAIGQFTSQRRKGQNDSFELALKEIEVLRQRSDRQDTEMRALHKEMNALRSENEVLRGLLNGATFQADQFRAVVREEVEFGVREIAAFVRPIRPGGSHVES